MQPTLMLCRRICVPHDTVLPCTFANWDAVMCDADSIYEHYVPVYSVIYWPCAIELQSSLQQRQLSSFVIFVAVVLACCRVLFS